MTILRQPHARVVIAIRGFLLVDSLPSGYQAYKTLLVPITIGLGDFSSTPWGLGIFIEHYCIYASPLLPSNGVLLPEQVHIDTFRASQGLPQGASGMQGLPTDTP